MITNATESDFLQRNFFPGFSDNSALLIKVVKGFDQRPQKIFLTSLIQKANNLIGKCIETAQFSEFATFFFWYIRSLLERISQGRMTNVNVCFSVLIPKKYIYESIWRMGRSAVFLSFFLSNAFSSCRIYQSFEQLPHESDS